MWPMELPTGLKSWQQGSSGHKYGPCQIPKHQALNSLSEPGCIRPCPLPPLGWAMPPPPSGLSWWAGLKPGHVPFPHRARANSFVLVGPCWDRPAHLLPSPLQGPGLRPSAGSSSQLDQALDLRNTGLKMAGPV